MSRFHRVLLIASGVLLAWLLMQAVHEWGHVAAAWATGGTVRRVVLHPLAISRTDVAPNPQPLVVAWGGPLIGVLLPLAAWGAAAAMRLRAAWMLRFFAGFCLLANGLYIGVGSFQGVGDAGDLLRHGAPRWTLWLFGLLAAPAGLALWHNLARHAGWGPDARPASAADAWTVAIVLVVLIALELALFSAL